MEVYIKKYLKNSILVSLLLVIFSCFLIFKPVESVTVVMIILGGILLVTGVIHCIEYFTRFKEFRVFSLELVLGILSAIAGIIILFNTNTVAEFLYGIIGAWIIIQSIVKIQLAFNMKAIGYGNWAIALVIAILTLIVGVVVLFKPFSTLIAITVLCGIVLLIIEIINIVESVVFMKD